MKIPQFLDTSRTLTTEIWKLAIKCLQIHVPMGLKKKKKHAFGIGCKIWGIKTIWGT